MSDRAHRPAPVFESPVGPEVEVDGRRYLWFGGTAYLGLQSRPELVRAAQDAIARHGLHPGSARAGYGTTPPLLASEAAVARFFGAEAALHVASGWAATALLLAALPRRRWRCFFDEHAHASAREALQSLDAPRLGFRHCDPDDLAAKLRTLRQHETPLVLTDGVFAGTGRVAPLAAYHRALAGHDDAQLLVDDAHGFGTLGEAGRGTAELEGLAAIVNRASATGPALRVAGTASKALGGHGGLVAGDADYVAAIRSGSTWFAGSTPPAVPVAAATAAAMQLAFVEPELRQRLRANASSIREGVRALGLTVPDSPAPIIALQFSRHDTADRLHEALRDDGILVPVLRDYGGLEGPALRIAAFATHETQHLTALLDALRRRS